MEVKNDVDTGFTPNTLFVPRATATAIKIALAKSNLLDDSNFEYIGTNAISSGYYLAMDLNNPTATIEKYADPNYSYIAQIGDNLRGAKQDFPDRCLSHVQGSRYSYQYLRRSRS